MPQLKIPCAGRPCPTKQINRYVKKNNKQIKFRHHRFDLKKEKRPETKNKIKATTESRYMLPTNTHLTYKDADRKNMLCKHQTKES